MTAAFPALEPIEIATGMALGTPRTSAPALPVPPPGQTARQALRDAILPALLRPPCVVSFSGGRDSSAVLAVATEVARSRGLPLPIPVALRFPAVARTQEDAWQEAVVRHLELPDFQTVVIDQELDLVGPLTTRLLLRHGLAFPPQVQFIVPVVEQAAGGTVLTGSGGDELFIPWHGTAAAALRLAVRTRSRRAATAGLLMAAPPVLQRAAARRRLRHGAPWLTAAARREAVRRQFVRTGPSLTYVEELQAYLGARSLELLRGCLAVVGADADVEVRHPFLDPSFAAAHSAGRTPETAADRAAAMRELVGDLLPAESVRRGTKAVFSEVLWGAAAREFAGRWSGAGVCTRLVDPVGLREVWRRPLPPARSWLLLQQAWLADHRGDAAA